MEDKSIWDQAGGVDRQDHQNMQGLSSEGDPTVNARSETRKIDHDPP